jgi:hypothetical protein
MRVFWMNFSMMLLSRLTRYPKGFRYHNTPRSKGR